jgi:hypothetical protein
VVAGGFRRDRCGLISLLKFAFEQFQQFPLLGPRSSGRNYQITDQNKCGKGLEKSMKLHGAECLFALQGVGVLGWVTLTTFFLRDLQKKRRQETLATLHCITVYFILIYFNLSFSLSI